MALNENPKGDGSTGGGGGYYAGPASATGNKPRKLAWIAAGIIVGGWVAWRVLGG